MRIRIQGVKKSEIKQVPQLRCGVKNLKQIRHMLFFFFNLSRLNITYVKDIFEIFLNIFLFTFFPPGSGSRSYNTVELDWYSYIAIV